ncbi:hypothetical protein AAIB33_10615 [Microbacterium sp. AZCO]
MSSNDSNTPATPPPPPPAPSRPDVEAVFLELRENQDPPQHKRG